MKLPTGEIKLPKTFDEATELLRVKPQPKDIMEQLELLKSKTPVKYHNDFRMFFEGAFRQLPLEGENNVEV